MGDGVRHNFALIMAIEKTDKMTIKQLISMGSFF